MTTLGQIRRRVIDWIEDDTETDVMNRAINDSVDLIQKTIAWAEFNKKLTVTPDDDGMFYAPPRCLEIVDVYPESNIAGGADFTFNGARRVQDYPRRAGHFFKSAGILEESDASILLSASVGNATLTEAIGTVDSITEAMVGQELLLTGLEETYRIETVTIGATNSMTVYPKFRYESDSAILGETRPAGTKMFKVFDSSGNVYTDNIVINYRQLHPKLVADSDRLLIPAPNTIALEAVRFMLRQTKYDVDAQRLQLDYEEYKRVECKQDVKDAYQARPRDCMFSIRSNMKGGRYR